MSEADNKLLEQTRMQNKVLYFNETLNVLYLRIEPASWDNCYGTGRRH